MVCINQSRSQGGSGGPLPPLAFPISHQSSEKFRIYTINDLLPPLKFQNLVLQNLKFRPYTCIIAPQNFQVVQKNPTNFISAKKPKILNYYKDIAHFVAHGLQVPKKKKKKKRKFPYYTSQITRSILQIYQRRFFFSFLKTQNSLKKKKIQNKSNPSCSQLPCHESVVVH